MTPTVWHKNWPAINALGNKLIQYLVTFGTDIEELARLQRGWPELFSLKPVPKRVSATMLNDWSEEIYEGHGRHDMPLSSESWLGAIQKVEIPIAHQWTLPDVFPSEIMEAFKKKELHSLGDTVHYQDRLYVVVELIDELDPSSDQFRLEKVTLVESNYIMLDLWTNLDPPTSRST